MRDTICHKKRKICDEMTNLPLFIGIGNVVFCKVKPPWECTAAEWSCCRCCDPPQAKNLTCQILCYDIGNCSAGLCYNDTLLVRMRTRMRGSIAAQSCAARQKCASFTVYYNERLCEAHFRFLWEMLFPVEQKRSSVLILRIIFLLLTAV